MKGIAIAGFGRIGRSTLRYALQKGLFCPREISDIKDPATLAALFKVDTNYGVWPGTVESDDGFFLVNGRTIDFINPKEEKLDWATLGLEVVIDCTGMATKRAGAQAHLDAGAKKVIVSAPSKSPEDCDAFILPGINMGDYDPDKHHIISMASCTTNALAPVIRVIRESGIGIESGQFTTVHAYTNSQSLTDQPMADRRDSWAAAENIIPSSSGAAKALGFIWPDLVGKITGLAYRVPTRTVSVVELVFVPKKLMTKEEINAIFKDSQHDAGLEGVMGVVTEEFASSRFIGEPLSSVVDLPLTQVIGNLVKVVAWYDNEWAYSARLAELAVYIANQ